MPRRSLLLATAAGVAVILPTGTMSAEPANAGDPLQMSADRLELDVEAKTALLTGHVKLTRGPMSLSCPRVDVRYDQVPHVTWAKGSGGVVADVKGVRAEAPEVEIDMAARSMELHGGVRLTRGEGWITAERASINIGTGKVSMSDVKGSIPIPKNEK
jgi:lipopolysaccharide transport protein LptA